MAAKFKLKGVPEGTGFHAFRHAYNANIVTVSTTSEDVRKVQLELLRQSDEATNRIYGASAPPISKQARIAHTKVAELASGV